MAQDGAALDRDQRNRQRPGFPQRLDDLRFGLVAIWRAPERRVRYVADRGPHLREVPA